MFFEWVWLRFVEGKREFNVRGCILVMGLEKRGMGRDSRVNFEEDEIMKCGILMKSCFFKFVIMR